MKVQLRLQSSCLSFRTKSASSPFLVLVRNFYSFFYSMFCFHFYPQKHVYAWKIMGLFSRLLTLVVKIKWFLLYFYSQNRNREIHVWEIDFTMDFFFLSSFCILSSSSNLSSSFSSQTPLTPLFLYHFRMYIRVLSEY